MEFHIIRESLFDHQIATITGTYSRMHDLDSAIDWLLSRDPKKVSHLYHVINNIFLWVTDEFVSADIPRVRIIFKYEEIERRVTLLEIESIDY